MTPAYVVALAIGLAAAVMILVAQHPTARPACDDCPGQPGCPCADGLTDPTTCTCGGIE